MNCQSSDPTIEDTHHASKLAPCVSENEFDRFGIRPADITTVTTGESGIGANVQSRDYRGDR
jgi:hypothetical protein